MNSYRIGIPIMGGEEDKEKIGRQDTPISI